MTGPPVRSGRHRGTVLFCPWTHGAGFGYVGRALEIAQDLSHAGYECVFGSDTAEGIVARAGMEVVPADGTHGVAVPDMPERRGEYIPIDNLDTVYAIARYYHASRVRAHVNADLAVIDAVQPDVVVVDMQPTAAIAARARGVPVLSVGDSDFLRDEPNSWMPWLEPEAACILPYPSCLPAFNTVLGELKLPPIDHVSDLLWGDLTLLASAPILEAGQPPLNMRGPLEWIGPVYWDPPWSQSADALIGHGRDRLKRIYVTLGHGGKISGAQMHAVLEGCVDEDWAVFASTGFRSEEALEASSPNLLIGGFTGIGPAIRWADVVISHGGYATVLATLLHGKPNIVIPFMSEQEANGLLFAERLGAGFLLRRTFRADDGRHFTFRLRYSGDSADGSFDANEVRQAVEEALGRVDLSQSALALSRSLQDICVKRSFPKLVETLR